ncbi:hypothetical protein BS47DRAFT_1365805 [Hydnum rufescens UP504]|uniref:Secreted protein n=1 Tax=Hydnum rufescens UP504 TaxID=1448309 RepID=A0A9P6DP49_9AGAM|nr:hypothetical protein BS47DRAFT_1365805 [Hydnum rufescens UP504]
MSRYFLLFILSLWRRHLGAFWVPAIADVESLRNTHQAGKANDHTPAVAGVWQYKAGMRPTSGSTNPPAMAGDRLNRNPRSKDPPNKTPSPRRQTATRTRAKRNPQNATHPIRTRNEA